jgi:hypothetical protein
MDSEKDDALALEALEFAYSGKKRMTGQQHQEVKSAIRSSRIENRESPGKRRSRFWGLCPVWRQLV